MVKDGTFITIQSFMVNDYKLKGNELLIYAIIFGFSQDGRSWYSGSRQYLADWCNISRVSVDKALNGLISKGLLIKNEKISNGTKICFYKAVEKSVEKPEENFIGCKETLQGGVKKLYRGCKETLHNNIEDNIDNKIDIYNVYETYLGAFKKNPNMYKLTEARKKKIVSRLKDAGKEMLIRAIENASKDDFYSGSNDRGWKADLDYITRSYEVVEKLANMQPKHDTSNDNYKYEAIPL